MFPIPTSRFISLRRTIALSLCLLSLPARAPLYGWGFHAHRIINEHAIFLLPPGLISFYKKHRAYIREQAVVPDSRRYVVEAEIPRHYIDLEHYTKGGHKPPKSWAEARKAYSPALLHEHGILPWHIVLMKHRLTKAFAAGDVEKILRYSADLGHYLADAHVPLHTTENYDGQLTDEEGIHAFWETRLPVLFSHSYDFFIGKATYISHPQETVWRIIWESYRLVPSVFRQAKLAREQLGGHNLYVWQKKGATLVKWQTRAYATAYHNLLAGQVEERMRASIEMIACFWYTCWVDAGSPDLTSLSDVVASAPAVDPAPEKEEEKEEEQASFGHKRICNH